MNRMQRLSFQAAMLILFVAGQAQAVPYTVLTYNVKGLPAVVEPFPGVFVPGNPDSPVTIPQIVTLLTNNIASWDVVALQEAFDPGYYAALTAPSPNTPAFDPPTGGAIGGSGLARLSKDPFTGFVRETWNTCGPNRSDCFANKGFSMARHTVDGAIVDIYNLHGDAGQEQEDRDARASQLAQLAGQIDNWSAGNAVIVLGDTNSLFNRTGESIGSFLTSTSLNDAWVEMFNGGNVPAAGSSPVAGCINDAEFDAAACERIDKVMFRSSASLVLDLTGYEVPADLMRDPSLNQLSDHSPVQVTFNATAVPEPGTAVLMTLGLVALSTGRRSRA